MTEERRLQEESYLDEQPLSEDEKKLVDEIYTRLDIFEEMNRPYHEEAKESREIVHMRDPKQDAPNRPADKKILQLQTLKSTINNVVADQMENMPEAKILPETQDKQALADDLQDVIHHIVYVVNDYERVHHRRAEDFYVTGTAITQIAWDPDMAYGKGDIALFRYPVEAFLWDPTAEYIQDSRAVIKVSWHPLSWFRSHYPEAGQYVQPDENNHNNVGMVTAQEGTSHSADEDRALLVEYWYRTYDAKTNRYKINVAYCAGGALLEHHKSVYAHGLYPFVVDVHDHIEGAMVGEGLVHELVPMMRYINRYAAYIDTNLRMSSKGRIIFRRGANIDKEAFANMDEDFVEGDRVEQGVDWNWIQNQPFNGMIAKQLAQLQSDLKADSGANQFTRGETTGGIVSGKAINSLIEAGGKISHLRTDQLNYGFKEIVEQILWLMAEFYDDKRMMVITGRDRQQRQITIDPQEYFGKKSKAGIPPPPYSVQIEIQSRDPARIANQNQMFMEAYTMAAQAQQAFPLSALFQMLNLDGKDRILPIIQANEQWQQQMMQMQQQMEQMSAQMEGLQKENTNLRTSATQMSSALANINATRGGALVGSPARVAEAGSGPSTLQAASDVARQFLMQPNYEE